MVVETTLDLGYLGLFLGLRINEIVRERGAASGFPEMRDSHGYVIQHLIESERTITELARRTEVSQQAISKTVAELVRLGIVESMPAADRRARRIRLSTRGWKAVTFTRAVRRRLEERLRREVGPAEYRRAKDVLLNGLRVLGGMQRIRTRRIRAPQ
jgi:DNA-binding MarR family transcriptional regulator